MYLCVIKGNDAEIKKALKMSNTIQVKLSELKAGDVIVRGESQESTFEVKEIKYTKTGRINVWGIATWLIWQDQSLFTESEISKFGNGACMDMLVTIKA